MLVKVKEFGYGGLNTRATSTGLPLLEMTELQDFRVVGKDLIQRNGIVRVAQLTGNMSAADFDAGSTEYMSNTVDTRVWALGLYWTVELAFEPDTVAGTQCVLCVGHSTHALIVDITGGNIRVRVWDSGGSATTITAGAAATSVQTVQITRSGATISTKLNNGAAVTGAISATLNVRTPVGDLRVARDDGTNYYDGTVCYVRLFSIVRANHNDRLVRLPNPRAEYVLCDLDFKQSAGGLVYDRSRYENHLIAQNTPSEIATLCHNPAPIRAVSMTRNVQTNRKEILVCAGGKYFIAGAD